MTVESNPYAIFSDWFEAAKKSESTLPEAMCLATADGSGRVATRMVLLKSFDDTGFVFYTNTESAKARDIAENANVSLNFHWKSLSRQVRIIGRASFVSDAEADAYFATRPRGAQIGAWASQQSRPMDGPLALEKRVVKFTAKFGIGEIPRPPFWTGYRVRPVEFEFWEERKFRLHRRTVYRTDGDSWAESTLFP